MLNPDFVAGLGINRRGMMRSRGPFVFRQNIPRRALTFCAKSRYSSANSGTKDLAMPRIIFTYGYYFSPRHGRVLAVR